MEDQNLQFSEPVYDPEATLIINQLPDVYAEKRLAKYNARELSRFYRDSERYQKSAEDLEAKIRFAERYLKENYEDLELHADELAEILGITLTNEVEFEMTVTITGTITLPMGKSFDDLSEYDFDVELSCNEMDYELDHYDVDIERIRES